MKHYYGTHMTVLLSWESQLKFHLDSFLLVLYITSLFFVENCVLAKCLSHLYYKDSKHWMPGFIVVWGLLQAGLLYRKVLVLLPV